MSDEKSKRTYTMRRRAEAQDETRRRITLSAVELHGTVGPSRTTMAALAEHAGVRRSTLYRHFPDEAAVFDACTAHWSAENPMPDPTEWAAISDPGERLGSALDDLYEFYARTERMLANLYRDEQLHEITRERFAGVHAYMDEAADVLMRGRGRGGAPGRRRRAAIGHAIAFSTWRSLVREQGLETGEAIALMMRFVEEA